MSGTKISDVMKAFQQGKVNRALGVSPTNSRYKHTQTSHGDKDACTYYVSNETDFRPVE